MIDFIAIPVAIVFYMAVDFMDLPTASAIKPNIVFSLILWFCSIPIEDSFNTVISRILSVWFVAWAFTLAHLLMC